MNNLWPSIMPGGGIDVNTKTAFGELATAEFEPQCGWSFFYQVNLVQIKQAVVGSGSVSQSNSFALLQTGADANGSAKIQTTASCVYTPGISSICRFTAVFDTPVANCRQLVGLGNDLDGWFFGYDGINFGVMRRRNGTDNWTYIEDWNGGAPKGFDPTKGNVYQIKYQWLGFGMQYFSIEGFDGSFKPVHNIRFANVNHDVSIYNPSLPIMAEVTNTGNTSNVALKTPSAIAGAQGRALVTPFEVLNGYDFEAEVPAGTGNYLFSFRNPETWLGKDNRLYIRPTLLTIGAESAKISRMNVYFGSILTAPTWVDVQTGFTMAQVDTVASGWTNGLKVLPIALGKSDSKDIDLSVLEAKIQPGQSITVVLNNAQSVELSIGFTFRTRI